MNTHSLLGPSSLRRRELCPGSLKMERALPETTSEWAEDGIAKHKAVAALLTTGEMPQGIEDVDDVLWCADQVRSMIWDGCHVLCEKEFDLKWLHPEIDRGTPDCVLYQDFLRAVVFDFKFGHGYVEAAEHNLQLACYALAIMHEYDLSNVQVCVLQPAKHRCDLAVPLQDTFDRIRDIPGRCLNPDAKLNPGEEQCKYCRASGSCPAQMALAVKSGTEQQHLALTKENVALLPMDKISEFLAAWEDRGVDEIIGAMRKRLFEALTVGMDDPKWCLGTGRSSRVWASESEPALLSLAEKLGVPQAVLYSRPELLSVAQMEKVLGKKNEVRAVVAPLIVTLAGKPKMERKSDAKDNDSSK